MKVIAGKYLKAVVAYLAAFIVFAILVLLLGKMSQPDLDAASYVPRPAEEVRQVAALRTATIDPSDPLVLYREVDYSAGSEANWYPKNEAPVLHELVEAGLLPPLHERIPEEPLVEEGTDGIGNYGGTWERVTTEAVKWEISFLTYPALVRFSPQGLPVVPHIAKSWDVSPDNKVFTFHLRKGMKWSDGHPFTADDILYWWQKECLEERIFSNVPEFMTIRGEPGRVDKIDDYTIRFSFPHPYGLFLYRIATYDGFYGMTNTPAHYLSRYHPVTGDQELLKRTMQALRLNDQVQVYNHIKNFNNPEHPRLWQWIPRTYRESGALTYTRNPYYFAVDTAGNQLPYLDRVRMSIRSSEMLNHSIAEGRADMQRCWAVNMYSTLMSQREDFDYEVYHFYPGDRSNYVIYPNLNRRVSDDDPGSANKHMLLNDKRFRQALSLAINRQQIIEAEYKNMTEPAQVDPGPQSLFHNPGLYSSYTAYDPERANQLLDEIGLTERDPEGYRLFPDGTRMTFILSSSNAVVFAGRESGQFVVEDWGDVGIRAIVQERSRNLFYTEKEALRQDFTAWASSSEYLPMMDPRCFLPTTLESNFALGYSRWYYQGGLYADDDANVSPGAIPIPEDHELYRAVLAYERVKRERDPRRMQAEFEEVLDIAAENVWTINISTPMPPLMVVKNGFRNVPRDTVFCWSFVNGGNCGTELFFWDEPDSDSGQYAQIRAEILTITPDPKTVATSNVDSETNGADKAASIIRSLIITIVLLVIVLVSLKHPYIGRRLLIMAPTLLIISVAVFIVIQLPPGDYISTMVMLLEERGTDTDLQSVERLKEMFYIDEPMITRYTRWLGLNWFLSFKREDMGLMQGYMGRSMETLRPVNEMLGDRLLLTVSIAFATIVFSWAVAIPIGIYSAVRQYSVSDYIFTFLGFLGMCLPTFLLALILMYASRQWFGIAASGLFSPKFEAQPDWSWAKVVDLLKHIWIPIGILGVAGTGTMIRVVRANMLDELRKPYVTTARAKGVRPLKLLLKYPVRIALNPVISGVGSLFPALLSAGAISAVVLSLPTIGPMLLNALMSEDMYLAGSLIMLLSLLGVLGTLVSDLLLLWVDPRIRMKGGAR